MEFNNTDLSKRLKDGTTTVGQIMQYKEEVKKINNMQESINQYITHASKDADLDHVIEKVKALGENRASIVRCMTWEELQDLFSTEDGTKIVLNVSGTTKQKSDFYKDFALYLVDSQVQQESIELTLSQFEEEIKVLTKELNDALGSIGDVPTMMETNMRAIVDETSDPIKKKLCMMGLKSMEDAWTLDTIVNHYNKIGVKNVLKEFYTRNGQKRISEKFSVFLKKTGLHSTMVNFPNIESRYLEDKYHNYDNLFVFMICKYFGANASDSESMNNKLLLTQLVTILTCLYADTLLPENKEKILKGIRNVLDLVVVK